MCVCVCACARTQVPWIVGGSVRDNIAFGSAWDEDWYTRVLQACALDQDLKQLPAGDQTELGERGVNLSGGWLWVQGPGSVLRVGGFAVPKRPGP